MIKNKTLSYNLEYHGVSYFVVKPFPVMEIVCLFIIRAYSLKVHFLKCGKNFSCDRTHRAVVLLLQQGGDVSSDGHLLGQILIFQTDPPPQLLQETQQTRPTLGARLQMGSAKAHMSVGPMVRWRKCTKAK